MVIKFLFRHENLEVSCTFFIRYGLQKHDGMYLLAVATPQADNMRRLQDRPAAWFRSRSTGGS